MKASNSQVPLETEVKENLSITTASSGLVSPKGASSCLPSQSPKTPGLAEKDIPLHSLVQLMSETTFESKDPIQLTTTVSVPELEPILTLVESVTEMVSATESVTSPIHVSTSKTLSVIETETDSKLKPAAKDSQATTSLALKVKPSGTRHSFVKSPISKPIAEKGTPKDQVRTKQKEPIKSVSQKTRATQSAPNKKVVETNVKAEKPTENTLEKTENPPKKINTSHENIFNKIQKGETPRSVKEQKSAQKKPTPSSTVSERTVKIHAKIPCAPIPSASKTINIARPSPSRAWNVTNPPVTKPVSPAFQSENPKPPSNVFYDWCQKSLKELKKDVDAEELLKMLLSFPLVPSPFDIIKEIIYANSISMDGRRFAETFIKYRKADLDGQLKTIVAQPVNAKIPNSFKVVTKKSKKKST
ncbi:hypothetical protein CLU79DRAFT_759073 [Phycomyces nitens]|nr:hypothetical protein CLU79DRAFT_759073 [Phycomyces nitens]